MEITREELEKQLIDLQQKAEQAMAQAHQYLGAAAQIRFFLSREPSALNTGEGLVRPQQLPLQPAPTSEHV